MATEKLKALDVQRLQPGLHPDGGGLYLQVAPGGGRSWLFRYSLHGKEHRIGLGSAKDISLKLARRLATQARELRATGVDPLAQKRERRNEQLIEQAKSVTFKECAEAYILAHRASWKNPIHRQQWQSTLEQYAYPIIGSLPVESINTKLVLEVLEPIWHDKTETASRLRGRIEVILDSAKVRELRDGENPARWNGHLKLMLATPSEIAPHEHHAALPYAEIGTFMADLRSRDGTSARALEFLILTGVRTENVIGATWSEIDLAARTWTIPGPRMKGRIQRTPDHRVPLSDRAIEILNLMQSRRENDFVFPGRSRQRLSNNSLLAMIRTMGYAVTSHGFRSTLRTWCDETTNFPETVSKKALAHTVSDKVEAAYRRGDLFEKRRRLMQAWSDYCGRPNQSSGNVTALRR